jgi:CBS domain containing-hemolysin-like protein
MAPAAFAESSYPDGRVLMDASFLLVVFLVTEGILFGMILSQLHHFAGEPVPTKLQIISGLIILMMILYPLYDSYRSLRAIPEYRTSATAWDARDNRIKTAVPVGVDQIVETSLAAPGHLVDLSTDPKYWVNTCMAYFYDIGTITATP